MRTYLIIIKFILSAPRDESRYSPVGSLIAVSSPSLSTCIQATSVLLRLSTTTGGSYAAPYFLRVGDISAINLGSVGPFCDDLC